MNLQNRSVFFLKAWWDLKKKIYLASSSCMEPEEKGFKRKKMRFRLDSTGVKQLWKID